MSIILLIIACACLINYLLFRSIELTTYSLRIDNLPSEFSGFKILQITDLHNKQFTGYNDNLTATINGVKPDIIVITGDMISRSDDDFSDTLTYISQLDYPIYYILGNHELDKVNKDQDLMSTYFELCEGLGINVLRNDFIAIEKGDQSINLYGLEIPRVNYTRFKSYSKTNLILPESFKNIDKDAVNILLAHNPAYFQDYADIGYDVILSGHVHGGGVRLPIVGGVFSSDMTLFPKYDAGKFIKQNSTLIVSRGLGGFRFFNRPEITVTILI